jgi:DNA-binding NarL/FixJ family response regulator
VLIVDDDADLRRLVRIRLSDLPNAEVVAEAGDGREAVDLAIEADPDVIVLDQQMPVLDGLHAIPELREAVPDAVIVYFTSTGAYTELADVCVAKPGLDELCDAVSLVIDLRVPPDDDR